jgi:putative FmdB family regulatory protein
MPIYEYRCEACGKISEFLLLRTDDAAQIRCKRCQSPKLSWVISRVRVIRSEESRLERLADPSQWGDLDENDPKSVTKWMRRMGKELGDEMGDLDMDEMEEAIEQEAAGAHEEGEQGE